jgi:hypothetical protein
MAGTDEVWHPGGASARATPDAIGTDLRRWATVHAAPAGRGLIRQLADVVTGIAPDLPVPRLALLARYSLWTFLLDDELDDVTRDPVALTGLAARLTTLVRTPAAAGAPPGTLDAMIAELIGEFRLFGAPALLARFTDALCTAIDAGVEHTLRAQQIRQGRAGVPTVEEYLTVAGRHINYDSFAYALLILARASPATAAAPRIGMALSAASRAIRIANDLASLDRDRAEGRLNIALLSPGRTAAATFEYRIGHYVRLHDHLLRDAAEAGVLCRSLHAAVEVYRVTDLR